MSVKLHNISDTPFFAPPTDDSEGIDVVFADAPPSDAEGCIAILRYYLPRMSSYSSIFIDRASTINHAYLLLEYVVASLQGGKIPAHLLVDLTRKEEEKLRELVCGSRFTLVHLTETSEGKHNKKQNSRAWIKIEPNDYIPHNNVLSLI